MTDDSSPSIARGFLFADLRNYSAWVESHGDHAAATLLGEYRSLVRQAVADFHGAEIKTEGDSFYVVFGSPSAAVKCGLRILELAAASHGAAGLPIPVGIGIHAGETVATDEGYVGSAVNVAARVCAQAAAGELLVSDAVRSLTRTYLDVTFLSRGRKRLKGISEPIALYGVESAGHASVPSRWHRLANRWPIIAAVLAAPLVVAAALIGASLIRETAGAPGPSQSAGLGATTEVTSASPASSASPDEAFPTASETRLLGLIGERERERCLRADTGDTPILEVELLPSGRRDVRRAGSEAGIVCELGGISAPDSLWLWELRPPPRAVGTRPDPAAVSIAAHGGLVGATPGTCREARPAIESWSFGDSHGTLVCHETDDGDAVLLWVHEDSRLFAKAVRNDRDMSALLDWWEGVGRFAGP